MEKRQKTAELEDASRLLAVLFEHMIRPALQRFLPVICSACMAMGFSGCSSLPVLHKDATFTAAELSAGGLAMGGVTREDSTGLRIALAD